MSDPRLVPNIVDDAVGRIVTALGPTVGDWDRAVRDLEDYAACKPASPLHAAVARGTAKAISTGADRLRAAAWRL